MSRMPWLSGCPSCAEPLEEGDRFCGRCGYSLVGGPDRPTIPLRSAGAHPAGPAPAGAAPVPSGGGFPAGAASYAPPAPPAPRAGPSRPDAGAAGRPAAPLAPPDPFGVPRPAAPPVPPVPPAPPSATGPYDTAATAPHVPPPPAAAPPGVRFDGPDHALPAQTAGSPAGPYPAPGYGPAEPGGAPDGPYAPRAEHGGMAEPEGPYPVAGDGHPAGPHPFGGTEPGPGHPADGTGAGSGPGPGTGTSTSTSTSTANGTVCVACRGGRVDTDGYCENCGHAQPRERDHMEEALETVAAVSDRGLRHHRNEDSFAVAATALPDGSTATVAVVCDGVSSASRPDDASAAAAHTANESLLAALPRGAHPQQAMHEAILTAANAVASLSATPGHQNAPACTLVGAVVIRGVLVIGWVGDSRAYWVPDDRSTPPARLTEDDSWAAQMVAAGLMDEAEAYADVRAHAITGWLGADAYEVEPHTAAFRPDRPGVVVVCTDGLWNYAESADEMARVLPADAAARPLHSAQVLVGHALDGGGHDNVTVAVVPVPLAGPSGPGVPLPAPAHP
ncbi:protein phosphatase 2C domain-containing protein [Streptomyces sp. NPDC093225]|uniref:protein phosphatase 2C domain-containing protein n=1 Tax=Streptomyces sp. NPDC093225 TaxID=3366034 RepID=UPI0038259FBB